MSKRVVIVTGASSGIGEATALAFGRAGASVVLVARRADRLARVAAQITDALALPADLARPGEPERVIRAAVERFGTVDVLVNNAGLGRYDWLERLPEDEIHAQVAVNLVAPILLARAALPVMHSQGRGTIINVSSIAGRIGTPTTSIYNATKFGLDGFSQALRREVLAQGIQVCVIYPGPTAGTEFSQHARPGSSRLHLRRYPWMYTSTDAVGRAIVALADRPRARRVVPGLFAPIIALNTLWPWLADVVVARAAAKARRG